MSYIRKVGAAIVGALAVTIAVAAPAGACAGLVTPNGNVRLLRTATLAAWSNGVEHYVTSFEFSGGGAEFGSIVPLPAIPTKVERGGDWTLQRLQRETQPQPAFALASGARSAESDKAEVIYETKIDALDIRILKGGGKAVGDWAREHGFGLTPDAPEVLDFYAARSKIFMAASFDAEAAKDRNQEVGEGTPIHLTIPVNQPWVPLRILGLGLKSDDQVDADVYLLTPKKPALLPKPGSRAGSGLFTGYDEKASAELLADLRSDKGMEWVPSSMWLTYLRIGSPARTLRHDLAMVANGKGTPSAVMAGLEAPASVAKAPTPTPTVVAEPSTTLLSTVTVPEIALAPLTTTPVVDGSGWQRAAAVSGGTTALLVVCALLLSALRASAHRSAAGAPTPPTLR